MPLNPAAVKLAVPDLISNSYFPAAAAVELGMFAREGLNVELQLIYPLQTCWERLRAGEIDFVGASSHSIVSAFPAWHGAKVLAGLGQGMYWFLVMRSDIGATRGDIDVVKGRKIGAAGWVDLGLRRLLIEAGIDPENDGVTIAPVPGAAGAGTNFGLTAAKALAERTIDGFWANGMAPRSQSAAEPGRSCSTFVAATVRRPVSTIRWHRSRRPTH